MRESGFYWIKHTKEGPKEIGFFSTDTNRWSFCGIEKNLEDKDLYDIDSKVVYNSNKEIILNLSQSDSTAVGFVINDPV